MLNNHPEELISAYLDGELTPEEKSEFEQALASDAALRDQLAELQELSLSIQQLAPKSRPADLHAQVMQAIESLPQVRQLASTKPLVSGNGHSSIGHSGSVPAPRSKLPQRRSSRRWASWISLALIAGVGLGTFIVPREWSPLVQGPGETLAMKSHHELAPQMDAFGAAVEQSRPIEPASESFTIASAGDGLAMRGVSPGPTLGSVPSPAPVPVAISMPSPAAPENVELGISATKVAGSSEVASAQDAPLPIVELTPGQIREKFRELKRPPVAGNSFEIETRALTQAGETPVVVVFTVVDVQQAMHQLQVLVQKERIRTVNDSDLTASNLKQATTSQPMSAFTFEMELDEPEMAVLLQSVPALDAVMYAPEHVAKAANSASTEPGLALNEISRASVPAQPQVTANGANLSVTEKKVDSQSGNSQFVFTQVTPGLQITAQQKATSQMMSRLSPIQGPAPESESMMSLNQASDAIGTLAAPGNLGQMDSFPQTVKQQSVPMGQKLLNGEAARYRALIHLQRSESPGNKPNSPQ